MPRSVIEYQKELPEIPGRCPWEKPTSFLVKDRDGWRIDESGRRKSSLLLVNKLRAEVDAWRNGGYPGEMAGIKEHLASQRICFGTGLMKTTISKVILFHFDITSANERR